MSEILDKIIDHTTLEINWDEVWKIPEFKKLKTVEQNPYWHGEIYVSEHTKNVVEAMYSLCPIEKR